MKMIEKTNGAYVLHTADGIREELKAQISEIRRYIEAVADIDPDSVESVKQQLAELHSKLAGWKQSREIRTQIKAELRERAKGFSLKTYEPDELWRHVWEDCASLREYIRTENTTPEETKVARERLEVLKKKLFVDAPLTVRRGQGRIVRLNKSVTSEVLGVDYESKKPTTKLAVVHHGVQEVFGFHWSLFSNDKEDGQKLLDEFQQDVMNQFLWRGVKELSKDGSVRLFGAVGSSSGHQKQEKVLMADAKLMKAHERFFWFGETMEEFSKEMTTSGSEFWKMRANLLRPLMKPFTIQNNLSIDVHDVLVVKDVEKIYEILNGRKIGKANGGMVQNGKFNEPVTLGDGAMLAIYPIAFQGQASTTLFKGFLADASSSIVELCKKHNISVEDFLNIEVMGIDGKMHRVGDFKVICGEGCWKGDKAFSSYVEYLGWMDEMEKSYPGISKLYLLRQAEEIEDEDKIRRLTRTLIQQWMHMSGKEIRVLTSRARKSLKKDKTFYGALNKLAGLWKTEEERTEVEKLFKENPWLICSPVIQMYLKEQWERKQIEAASGKFRTEGQYPYIMQDPVALLEVWVLGMDPNSPDLGILKAGFVSCADVPDGRKLLCVRFPANFLTAQVKINRACKEAFASLNGVLVLSVHDLILIAQDGDVDGDEMCVIYNKLAIALTERMNAEFNPPVVLFKHGGKPPRTVAGSKQAFVRRMAESLWKAKRYDSVGLYANLAMRCCYLATIAHANGETKKRDEYLLWMSAASTGAIIALDQVKGNDVDPNLIKWLDDITEKVDKAFRKIAERMGVDYKAAYKMRNPHIQWYVAEAKRRPIKWSSCLPTNPDNFLDEVSDFMIRDTGKWEDFDFGLAGWNEQAAFEGLTNGMPTMKVPEGTVTKEMIDLLGDNWFKLKAEGPDATEETLKKLRPGNKIGLKEMTLLLWRNESSMAYTMEGRQLWEKKEEYYTVCREILRMLIQTGDWSKKQIELSDEDRWNVLVNALVQDALELKLGFTKDGKPITNGVDKKGSYAMFVLKLISPEIRRNSQKNNIDTMRFFGLNLTAEDLEIELELEQLEDEKELFESSSVSPEFDAPVLTNDDLIEMAPPKDEVNFTVSDDIDYSQCPDC